MKEVNEILASIGALLLMLLLISLLVWGIVSVWQGILA